MIAIRRFVLVPAYLVALFSLASVPLVQSQQTAQPASTAPARSVGTVKAISGNTITLTTDSSAEVNVVIQPSAVMVKTAPGHKDLQGATAIQLQDVKIGDRMLVRGTLSEDGKTIMTTSGVVMKHEDIAQKQQQEREDWNKRGVAGVVKSIDSATGVITVSTGSMAAKMTAVHVSKDTILRRYAPDSVKFDDAKAAPLDQIKPGDQLRARGERSADGSELTAEEIVSGSFRNIAGTVAAIDPSNNVVTVTDLLSKKPVMVKVDVDSQLRKLPPMVAQAIAARLKGQGAGAAPGAPASSGNPSAAAAPAPAPSNAMRSGANGPGGGGTAGNGGNPRAGAGGDFQQMLNRMPPLTISDLQKGEAVILVTTEGTSTSEPTAITLLTGVEPLLSASPRDNRAAMSLSPWSLGAPTGDTGP